MADTVIVVQADRPEDPKITGPRALELLVFPVSENSGWVSDSQAIRIYSDGTRDSLAMSATVEKSIMGVPNSSTVTLYNLSSETRNALNSPSLKAILRVSDPYSNGKFQEIYTGGILASSSMRQGADIVTTVYILEKCIKLMSSVERVSFGGYTKVNEGLKSLKTLLGVSNVVIKGIPDDRKFYSGGFSFAGQPIDLLNKLAFQEGFSWNFDNGELIIIADDYVSDYSVPITYEDTLIQATPILSGAWKTQNGVAVKAYLMPWLTVGNLIDVESKTNPSCNRKDLRVHTIKINVSTFSNQWEMDMNCYIPVTRALWNI